MLPDTVTPALTLRPGSQDVDTIYLSHDSRELSLQDFDHLDPK